MTSVRASDYVRASGPEFRHGGLRPRRRSATVTVKPNAKGRKALKKARKLKKLKLGLKLTGTDAVGNVVSQTAALTLKR